MYRIRARYEKTDRASYLGHLEIIKVFERAFRRGGIPLKYSEGFNPHPKMSFALPSSVGFSSTGEYIDVEVTEMLEIEEFIANMNNTLPEGLRISGAGHVDVKAKSLMSMVDCSEFIIGFIPEDSSDGFPVAEFDKLLEAGPLVMQKRTKSGKLTEKNLNENILGHKILNTDDGRVTFKVILSAGSRGNLNPAFLLKGIADKLDVDINPYKTNIHRVDLFTGRDCRDSLEKTISGGSVQ